MDQTSDNPARSPILRTRGASGLADRACLAEVDSGIFLTLEARSARLKDLARDECDSARRLVQELTERQEDKQRTLGLIGEISPDLILRRVNFESAVLRVEAL